MTPEPQIMGLILYLIEISSSSELSLFFSLYTESLHRILLSSILLSLFTMDEF